MPPAIITPMLVGAAVGAVSAAIQGGNILKGALFGAIGGGIAAAFTGLAGGAAAGATEGAVGGTAAGAEGAALSGVADTAAVGATGVGEVATTGATSFGSTGGSMVGGASPISLTNPLPFTGGEGMASAAPSAGSWASQAGATSGGSTGLGGSFADTSLGGVGGSTGLGNTASYTGYGAPAGGAAPSTSTSFLDKAMGMLNNRFVTDTAGRVLTGYAQGQAQEAQIKAREQEQQRARDNARFGNVGSRYNASGMMGPATYAPR